MILRVSSTIIQNLDLALRSMCCVMGKYTEIYIANVYRFNELNNIFIEFIKDKGKLINRYLLLHVTPLARSPRLQSLIPVTYSFRCSIYGIYNRKGWRA